ncbi:hypothetical protein OIU77_009469, partial [Salix suchowensis]
MALTMVLRTEELLLHPLQMTVVLLREVPLQCLLKLPRRCLLKHPLQCLLKHLNRK